MRFFGLQLPSTLLILLHKSGLCNRMMTLQQNSMLKFQEGLNTMDEVLSTVPPDLRGIRSVG